MGNFLRFDGNALQKKHIYLFKVVTTVISE